MADRTFHDGLNEGISKYYEDAINGINGGSTIAAVIKPLDEGVKQLLLKYPEAK